MKRAYSIKKNQEMEQIIRIKNRVGNQNFIIYKQKCEANKFRFAISIGKKYGIAVERVQMKRRIREIIGKEYPNLQHNYEIVIVVKPASRSLNFQEIQENLQFLLLKLNLYEVNK